MSAGLSKRNARTIRDGIFWGRNGAVGRVISDTVRNPVWRRAYWRTVNWVSPTLRSNNSTNDEETTA